MNKQEQQAIQNLLDKLDSQVLDLAHQNVYDYIENYPQGDKDAPMTLKMIDDLLQDRYEYENDL